MCLLSVIHCWQQYLFNIMYELELSKGKKVIIDSDNYDAKQYKWYAVKCDTKYYAVRTINLPNKKTKKIYLHKQIMGDEGIVDFINGDTLDCRIENLRVTNRSNDAKNRFAYGTSKYLGVNFHKTKKKYKNKKGEEKIYESKGRWLAKIKIEGKYKHLGLFDTEIEAAKKYDESAKKYHKEFARLNF